MLLQDFDYQLPEELIARRPLPRRDASRMLVMDKKTGHCEIRGFNLVGDYLNPGDCVVINNTKVFKARLYGIKNRNGARIEVLLLEPDPKYRSAWRALVRPSKRIRPDSEITILAADGGLTDMKLVAERKNPDETWTLSPAGPQQDMMKIASSHGHIPLPPYLKRDDDHFDAERYQTVYASESGAVAAPTAGLHFTGEVFADLAKKGVAVAEITLHVGAGTFKPVDEEIIENHKMHGERFSMSPEAAGKINAARKNGKKVMAVGTTAARTLETCSSADGSASPCAGETSIFIYPPYKFRAFDMLLTNFHLPKSTLLMLVSAFAGRENILSAYELAKSEKMRFYSYGDCMLLL